MARPNYLQRLFARPELAWRWYPDPDFTRWDGGPFEEEEPEPEEKERDLKREVISGGKKVIREVIKRGNEAALLAALDNAQFGVDEAIMLLERGRGSPKVLGIIGTRSWAQEPTITRLLCFNPKTPFHASKGLVQRLDQSALSEIIRNSSLTPALVREARKILARKRGKKH